MDIAVRRQQYKCEEFKERKKRKKGEGGKETKGQQENVYKEGSSHDESEEEGVEKEIKIKRSIHL